MGKTMHEEYGDDSDHQVCKDCGFCLDCCDCDRYGCGQLNLIKKASKIVMIEDKELLEELAKR